MSTHPFSTPESWLRASRAASRSFSHALGLPFDVAREEYSKAVRAGIAPRSMLASRDFSQALDALERLSLGPFARRV